MPRSHKTPTLAECLVRASGREFERRLHTARYYAGIIVWRKQGREAEAKQELRRAAEDMDALPSLDRWERYWRTRIAEELGDKATVARLEREANKPESTAPAYDESCLRGHTGTLTRRAS